MSVIRRHAPLGSFAAAIWRLTRSFMTLNRVLTESLQAGTMLPPCPRYRYTGPMTRPLNLATAALVPVLCADHMSWYGAVGVIFCYTANLVCSLVPAVLQHRREVLRLWVVTTASPLAEHVPERHLCLAKPQRRHGPGGRHRR
jgi:hypothetical protein